MSTKKKNTKPAEFKVGELHIVKRLKLEKDWKDKEQQMRHVMSTKRIDNSRVPESPQV